METLDHDFLDEDKSELEYFGYTLAPLGKRFVASLLEGIIQFAIFMIIILLMGRSINDVIFDANGTDSLQLALRYSLGIILAAIYYPAFSGNIGHKILNIKVISTIDGSDYQTASNGMLRELLKLVFGLFLIPVIWLLWDKRYQNLYDKVMNTIVVENEPRLGY